MLFTHRPYDDVPPFLRSAEAAMEWLDLKGLVEKTDFCEYYYLHREFSEDAPREEIAKHPEVIRQVRYHRGQYAEFAKEVYAAGVVEVFRTISVESHDRVSLGSLGRYWSRYKIADSYWASYEEAVVDDPEPGEVEERHDVLIKARVEPTAIDWEEGFVAFLVFGEAEWEVRLRPDVPVEVLEVDGGRTLGKKTFSPPVVGNSGPLLPPRGKGAWA